MRGISAEMLLILCSLSSIAQTERCQTKGYLNFDEFKQNNPSLSFECVVAKRMGGIENYKMRKIRPGIVIGQVENEIWGVKCDDDIFINSSPYSRIEGYNRLLVTGYYSCFFGEIPITPEEQTSVGILAPEKKWRIPVQGTVGYVLFPNGKIKVLLPEILPDLIKDNEKLAKQVKADNIAYLAIYDITEFYLLFDYLEKYNATKNSFR